MIHYSDEEVDKIYSADADSFSFVDVAGSFIQNIEFANGLRKFQIGQTGDHEAFLYQVLSSASGDIGQTIYDNVKRYVSYVSDVDVCKVRSLKSMLKLFGFNYTIFDKFDSIPQELVDLIDILSINRKFLVKNGWLKPEFIDLLSAYSAVHGDVALDSQLNLQRDFTRNTFILSACPCLSSTLSVNTAKLLGAYVQRDDTSFLSGTSLPAFTSPLAFQNNYGYTLLSGSLDEGEDTSCSVYDTASNLLVSFPSDEVADLTYNGASRTFDVSNLTGDPEFMSQNSSQKINVQLTSIFTEEVHQFDDGSYQDFLESIFEKVIYGYITLPYNAAFFTGTQEAYVPIYPDLGDEYYRSPTSLRDYKTFEDDEMLSVKAFYHVQKSFDQSGIVDRIEAGDDDLNNYSGAELSILQHEIQRRHSPVDLSSRSLVGMTARSTSLDDTRATFYRKRKVLEYAKFVDGYFNHSEAENGNYDVDPNYYVVENNLDQISSVINLPLTRDPRADINQGMIEQVAKNLANLTLYIQKIREKIKQQTQKNYMKGTNLLLVYIINEYLIDYAKHNRDQLIAGDLSAVYRSLSAHQFKESEDTENYTINSVEFYDETDYTNISAATSRVGNLSAQVNRRYWESASIDSKGLLKDDGKYFKIEDIEKFYLSTLNLNSPLSGNLPDFLSTIFDLGADPTFIYKMQSDPTLSIFSSVLSSGEFAHQIYEELLNLSGAWLSYRSWLKDDYEYPAAVASAQLSDSLENSIYADLSAKYLSAVSAVYDANIQSLENLSSSTDQLLENYTSFITSDYSYYYKKFESKYCYEDFDVDTGAYLHNWYFKNPDYDEEGMSLYEHLYQFDRYSNSSNIVNWALSDIIDYVESGFDSIYDSLRREVTSKIGGYGFVDINALTLDDELTYTYNFLSNLLEMRKQFLKGQLAALQEQAMNVKTQYETVNNTFTNAVASFNDNNDGYKLGDSAVYAVSTNQVPAGSDAFEYERCQRDSSKPAAKSWMFCVNVNGYWYYGANDETTSGRFVYEKNTISPVYKSDDTLRQRCAAVKAYMAAPTHFDLITVSTDPWSATKSYHHGLQNEGVKALADNTSAALADIEQAYDNIVGMASAMFGIRIDSPSADIYQNILALVEKLVAVDETFFDNDANITEYKGYLRTVISLSADYLPVKEAFDSIFKSSELGGYMINFIPVSQLTKENIDNLRRYRKKTDATNLETIREKVASLYDTFNELLDRKSAIELCIHDAGVSSISFTTGNALEEYIYQIHQVLLNDIYQKTIAGNAVIDHYKEQIQGYADTISDEISADLDSIAGLETAVSSRLGKLNFFDHDNYKQYKEMFLTYGGQDFCYDPYYNIKNRVHPSYQLHPYLWNFVRKLGTDSLVRSGYQTKAVGELEEDLVNSYITKYINRYGMAVDTWINANKGLVDYTGYLSRYEMSENYAPATGVQNEVVDYDGAFYPPAVGDFRSTPGRSINSVGSEMTKSRCIAESAKHLPDPLSAGLQYDAKTHLVTGQKYSLSAVIVDPLTSYIPASQASVKQALDSKLIGQQVSAVTTQTIVDALDSGLPKTFFEKYYKHLGLVPAECQRVARQLTEYKDKIIEITNPANVQSVYDIYKYGVDINGNSYILYKNYDYSRAEELKDMSFSLKRDTLGEMWIRLASHPIAFPAFSGKNPMYYTEDPRRINMSILSAAVADDPNAVVWADEDHNSISMISSDMKVFYDFELSKSKTSIAYAALNGDYPLLSAYRRFDLAWIVGAQIQSYYDQHTDIEWLQILNSNGAGVERIDFNYNSLVGEPHYIGPDAISADEAPYPALIGFYPVDDSNIDFVYLEKMYRLSGDVSSAYQLSSSFPEVPELFGVKIRDGVTYTPTEIAYLDLGGQGQQIVGDTACVGYDSSMEQTVLAVTTRTRSSKPDSMKTGSTLSSTEVDFEQNSEGPVITDPTASEMNSHDYFVQNVTIAKFKRKSTSFQRKSTTVHNINADISYIPSYPSLSNEALIYTKDKWGADGYYCIELLGMSKDIDGYIKLVNPNPDPYLDYDKIIEEFAHGRVYEDYNSGEDKTFKSISNPSLNPNSPNAFGQWATVSYEDGSDYIEYAINLSKVQQVSPYTARDYEQMKLFVYNKNTLGKEPYLVTDLKLVDGREVELSYSDDSGELGEIPISTPATERNEYCAVGTHESFDLKTRSDSNRFANISKITCRFYSETDQKVLSFKFYIQDKAFPFFIPSDAFRVVLHNPYDLSMFKYYHLFDAYGVARCDILASRPELLGQPDDGRGWGIYIDPAKVDIEKFKDKQASYVVDDNGLTSFLKDIELSDYSYLSDIYALSGYKGLGFKYDEELRFAVSSDLYYYPTMNLSYPKQAADYLASNEAVAGSSQGQLSVLKSIYDRNNLFVLDLDSPSAVADKIGVVAVPVMLNEVDDIRAYEDWLDTSSFTSSYVEDGEEKKISVDLKFSEIYDADDPRAFQWVHFAGEVPTRFSSPTEVPQEWWKNKTVSQFVDNVASVSSITPTTSEDLTSDVNTEHVYVDVNSATAELSRLLKLFVNYRKNADDSSIDLYFNYFNWFDTPYVKIVDNKTYLDTIDSTYLKLKTGEDGDLDIVIQVKYYNGQQLCGYRNIKVLGYHIWNVSDDKPKFVIQKTYEVQKNSQGFDQSNPAVVVSMRSIQIDLNNVEDDTINIPLPIGFSSNVPLSSSAEFYVNYPEEVLSVDDGVYGYLEIRPAGDGSVGLKKIRIYNTKMSSYQLPFKTILAKNQIATKYRNTGLYISIDEPLFLTETGKLCDVDFNDCTVTFVSGNQIVLANNNSASDDLKVYRAANGGTKVVMTQN